jgi:hypothetical protein
MTNTNTATARPALHAWEAMIDNGTALTDPAAFDAACRAAADEDRTAAAVAVERQTFERAQGWRR